MIKISSSQLSGLFTVWGWEKAGFSGWRGKLWKVGCFYFTHSHTDDLCVLVCMWGWFWLNVKSDGIGCNSINIWLRLGPFDGQLDSSGTNQGCGLDELRTPWSGWPGSSCVNCIRSEFMSDGRLDKLSKMIYGSYFIQEIWWVFACGWDSPQRDGEPEIVPKLALLMKNNVIINNWSSKELLYNLKIEIKLQRKFFQQK